MKTADLGGPLLASVSRSFYLTIRLLPGRLRAPIGLAYLLARASDTIADSDGAPAPARLRHLAAFAKMIARGERGGLAELQRDIQPTHPGEHTLIAQLGRCLEWLASLAEYDRAEIAAVMEKIIRGQTLDLQRFGDGGEITALPSAAELDEYTYLVAGCVGEFWTRICLHHLRRYAALEREPLTALGIRYGQGLQLVNILRDLPADLRAGRCYLPADELRAAGAEPRTLLLAPAAARPVLDRWLNGAAERLDDGRRYIAALRSPRLRAGCFLPWRLGLKTLDLLRAQSPLEATSKIKVSRGEVRAALFAAAIATWSNAPLRTR